MKYISYGGNNTIFLIEEYRIGKALLRLIDCLESESEKYSYHIENIK